MKTPKPARVKLDPVDLHRVLCLLQAACANMAGKQEMYSDWLARTLTEAAQILDGKPNLAARARGGR